MGGWYTIGARASGSASGSGVILSGLLGVNRSGVGVAAIVGALRPARPSASLVGDVAGGGRGRRSRASSGALSAAAVVHGALRRGATTYRGRRVRLRRSGCSSASLALVPIVGYVADRRRAGARRPDARAAGGALRRAANAGEVTPPGRSAPCTPVAAAEARAHMVEEQLRRRGITDERVLAAMGRVPRELFVPEDLRRFAYEDGALPIGYGQTISQPFIVATICQLLGLSGDERVLDVGTGSGYQAAVLAELAAEVVTIERVPELAAQATRCARRGRATSTSRCASETARSGVPDRAPFDGDRGRRGGAERSRRALRAARRRRPARRSARLALGAGARRSSRATADGPGRARVASRAGSCPLVGAEGFGRWLTRSGDAATGRPTTLRRLWRPRCGREARVLARPRRARRSAAVGTGSSSSSSASSARRGTSSTSSSSRLLVHVLGLHYIPAAVCSFLVAVTNNYTWNRLWTFRDQRGHVAYQGMRFLVVSTLALGANLARPLPARVEPALTRCSPRRSRSCSSRRSTSSAISSGRSGRDASCSLRRITVSVAVAAVALSLPAARRYARLRGRPARAHGTPPRLEEPRRADRARPIRRSRRGSTAIRPTRRRRRRSARRRGRGS